MLAFVFFSQASLLYLPGMPSRELFATPDDIGLPYETVWLTTEDDVKLNAWYVSARNARG
ncbi:MAG: alpha/beta hydrolase, partial [Burkholderiales bacterium]|nr:alpha/beta hydrolase [Burkholderiales bacterium]